MHPGQMSSNRILGSGRCLITVANAQAVMSSNAGACEGTSALLDTTHLWVCVTGHHSATCIVT